MNKTFYIVPSTKDYYDTVESDSSENALAIFAENMDSNMSAYFRAVDKEPVYHIHGYEYPKGKFQYAMSIIAATAAGNTKSIYYDENSLKGVDLTNTKAISELQQAYDMIHDMAMESGGKLSTVMARKGFYKMLKKLTGFSFDKEKPDPEEVIYINVSTRDYFEARDLFYHKNFDKCIPHDTDNAGKLLITRRYLKKAVKRLEKAGIEFEILC